MCYYVFILPLLVYLYANDLQMPNARNFGNSECIISFNDYNICLIFYYTYYLLHINYFIPIYKHTDEDTGIRIIRLMSKVIFEPRSHSNISVVDHVCYPP